MESMAYNCGYCGAPGVAKYEPEFVKNAEFWKGRLHCNRCADFRLALTVLRDRCKAVAILWWQESAGKRPSAELEKELRSKLESITRQVSYIVSKHWNTNDTWDAEFAALILDKPQRAEFIVMTYAEGIKKEAARARAARPMETPDLVTI